MVISNNGKNTQGMITKMDISHLTLDQQWAMIIALYEHGGLI